MSMKVIAMGLLALAVWAQDGEQYAGRSVTLQFSSVDFGVTCLLPLDADLKDYIDAECVEYIDETGQRVGILARKVKAKPVGQTNVIASTGGWTPLVEWKANRATDETVSGIGLTATSSPKVVQFQKLGEHEDYLRIEVNPDYTIKTATFRLPTSTVMLTGKQLTQAVQAWVARRSEKLNEAGWDGPGGAPLRTRSSGCTPGVVWIDSEDGKPYVCDATDVAPAKK